MMGNLSFLLNDHSRFLSRWVQTAFFFIKQRKNTHAGEYAPIFLYVIWTAVGELQKKETKLGVNATAPTQGVNFHYNRFRKRHCWGLSYLTISYLHTGLGYG